MTKRSHHRNPFASRDEEIAKLRARVQELELARHTKAFSEAIGKSLMLMLIHTPYNEWPDVAKRAYEHEKEKTPTLAYLWMQAKQGKVS